MKIRGRAGGIALLVGLLGMAGGGSSRAQVKAATSCDADELCDRLARHALDYSQTGRFEAAQRSYKAAYARRPDTKLLFNLARVLHKDGQLAEAVTYYQMYLDAGAEGNAGQRLKAQQRLDEARSELSLGTVTGKPASNKTQPVSLVPGSAALTSAPPTSSVPVYRKWWLWTIVGVAAAGAAVGIGLGVAAQRPDLTGYTNVDLSGN